ncbi:MULTISPECIES: sensor histidine kinase [Myroides]|uniref:Histidine kinase n=1 Tax=Myroides albus TaxID=2562892 RepID=A0A6I3LGP0_9FLAO|nr:MULTISPECIES: sensor histidine kinase [Myroides]MTG97027.1 histidine kinase [Myroides albus]MVX35801.1 histidine kinase [Myroides sp. LoEW2-1]UVD78549.1 histidine kinase [Myroides albus]
MLIGIVILIVTIIAIYFLSSSINKNNQETYKYITSKNFYQKLRSLEQEFYKVDEHLLSLDQIATQTPLDQLKIKFEVLNEVYSHGNIIKTNWYIVLDQNNQISDYYVGDITNLTDKNIFVQHILNNPDKSTYNDFVADNKQYFWLMYNSYKLNDNKRLVYGITVDMKMFHKYLTTIDVTTPNYAYIFTKEGLCIYHPEISIIGKNVFELHNISPKDTIPPTKVTNPDVVESEYLKLDVFRFVSSFKSENFKGYITVNFPKFNVDDNIAPIERNTILILITTVLVIVMLFYFFTLATRKVYIEKEELAVENEKVNKEKALIQLQQLKNQINPHFLFNSLNSLFMLIDLDKSMAQNFTLNLSKIYRYLITPPQDNIVNLEDEIFFITKYIELQKIRFKDVLEFEINDNRKENSCYKIPFLALQITIENALKHNILTGEKPLLIQLIIDDDKAKVINNLQPKKVAQEGELFGLKYLESIYKYYNITMFSASAHENTFVCILPLIKC